MITKKFIYELYPVKSPASRLVLDREMTLKEMQKFVGGYIEMLPFENGHLIFNEEGRMKNLKTNQMFRGLVGNVIKKK
jgi:hypothetical protein